MKKGLLCSIISLIILGCNKNDNLLISQEDESSNFNDITQISSKASTMEDYCVSLDDAHKFAEAMRPGKSVKVEPYIVEKDTLLFFINFNEGWLILAGDKRLNPFVAESQKGNISMPTSNENLNIWIDSYADEIRIARTLIENKENEFTDLWSKISQNSAPKDSDDDKSPETKSATYKWAVVKSTYMESETYNDIHPHLLTTKWGQGPPWNTKLPMDSNAGKQCYTGCTAVAISQILYYMHYHLNKPLGLYHNISVSQSSISSKTANIGFSRSDYYANSTRWDSMALKKNSSGSYTYVGDLMLDVGNRVGMEYSGTGSGASISLSALSNYGLTYSSSSYDYQTIKDDIVNDKPVNIIAWTQGKENGHSWVIDGIAERIRRYVTHIQFEYTDNWMNESEYYDTFYELRQKYHIDSEFDTITKEAGTYVDEFLLMNWGYDGKYDNAYYGIGLSDIWHANSYDWKYDKVIKYDFR